MKAAAIRFGTSGWRGLIGEEVTLPRARALARAVAHWLSEEGHPARVLVAHDSRLGGERLAREAAGVLAAEGVRVERASGITPTPVAAWAVVQRGHGAGLVFTASHNPPGYQGLKVMGPKGSVLGARPTGRIERLAARALSDEVPALARGAGRAIEPIPEYLAALRGRLDAEAFARRRPHVFYDGMHGAGAGVLDGLLADLGARLEGRRLAPDVRFGGASPDPTPERLAGLAQAVGAGRGLRIGLATDGDADRYAAVDADGRILSATQAMALLVDHLARTGRISKGVAVSVATGSLVERVARAHGLPVTRHAIGFKWLSRALLEGRADCAGEESGGFVWAAHGVDKDGILASALLAEIVATSGAPLGERLAELERRHGESHCGRASLAASGPRRLRLERLRAAPPARVGDQPVRAADVRDGLRLVLPDGFLMLRGSGTEPVLRIYAEAGSAAALRARLARGARWLGALASSNLAA